MSRKKKKKPGKARDKKTNLEILSKKNFKKAAQWKVDYDYLEALSDKEAAWLAKFSKEYYDSSYTEWAGIKKPINKLDARPRNWRVGPRSNKLCNEQNNAQAADLYNYMFPYGNFHHFDESFAQNDGANPEDILLEREAELVAKEFPKLVPQPAQPLVHNADRGGRNQVQPVKRVLRIIDLNDDGEDF